MSLEQAVFKMVHDALSADATLNGKGIIASSIHRTGADRAARVYPYIEVDIDGRAADTEGGDVDETLIRVRIVADKHDAVGTGDTPEAAADIDTIADRVNALLHNQSPTISGFSYSTLRRVRRYPAVTSGQEIVRILDFTAWFGG